MAHPPTPMPPSLTSDQIRQGIQRLSKRLVDVEKFDPTSVTEQNNIPHVDGLSAAVDEALVRTFGAGTLDYKRYSDAAYFDNGPFNYAFQVPISKVHASLAASKARSIALLTQAISSLRERLEELPVASPQNAGSDRQTAYSRRVFVVHGHDEGAREAVAVDFRRDLTRDFH
jgi:hypothetical protein